MIDFLFVDGGTLAAYCAASAAIILAPGPAQALVIARSIERGPKAGVLTGLGLNAATLVFSLAAALGISAVIASSPVAFEIVKYAGAAYLLWLGIQTLASRNPAGTTPAPEAATEGMFRKAFITGLLNPKVAVFFVAFLPQFVDPRRGPAFIQFLVLGCILAVMDSVYESVLAVFAGSLSRRRGSGSRTAAMQRWITGIVLIILGLRLFIL